MTMPVDQAFHRVIADDDRIYPLDVVAHAADVSLATLRRCIKDGSGPVVTRVSLRRIGVRGRHYCAWLNDRASS